jgi:hypothetical protein
MLLRELINGDINTTQYFQSIQSCDHEFEVMEYTDDEYVKCTRCQQVKCIREPKYKFNTK